VAEIQEKTNGPDHYEIDGANIYLLGSQCSACGAAFYPEQTVCGRCGHRGSESLRLGPDGILYTWTRVHQSTPEFKTPYVLSYVDFPQNVRVLVPLVDNAEPKIGMAVKLVLAPGPKLSHDGQPVELVHVAPVIAKEEQL
jgi:uncharacterized OB-fold protein